MTWIAPEVTRIDEPFTGPERGILDGFLDWHRSTLLWKCAGLTGQQLALASVPPSNLSLPGLVRHMADVERAWFRIAFCGEPLPRLHEYEDVAFEHARRVHRRRGSQPGVRVDGSPGPGPPSAASAGAPAQAPEWVADIDFTDAAAVAAEFDGWGPTLTALITDGETARIPRG
jgi:hypothetical protein